ncbi:MAG: porin [Planctomycetaceae bacterium]|nr:porin [Planctomycetaceae bacterium]
MKSQFALVLGLVVFAFVVSGEKARAADCCSASNPCGSVCQTGSFGSYLYDKSIFNSRLFENQLIGKKSKTGISFYGWMLTGVTVNNHGATTEHTSAGSAQEYNNRRNSDGSLARDSMADKSGNTYVLMLEEPTEWKINQLWLGAKKELDDCFGVGFQSDFVYGTDARYARNWGDRSFDYDWGSGDYYASFSQLYGTIGTKDLFVKVGKFAGSFSYEGLAAPREYFYTHANICYGRPLTTQGVMLEWHPNKKWMLTGGWLAGTFTSFDNPYDDNGFLGKATYSFTKNVSLSYRLFYNDKGARPTGIIFGAGNKGAIDCINTLIFTWKINKCWSYMGEIAYTDGKVYGTTKTTSDAWGINNHLIRTFNEKFSIGLRGEYHHSHGSTFDNRGITIGPVSGVGGQGGDLWEATLAAHYNITPKVTFRPEIRYDYANYSNGYRPFGGDESKNDQICGGASFIVMF